jgi:hypothetical protein
MNLAANRTKPSAQRSLADTLTSAMSKATEAEIADAWLETERARGAWRALPYADKVRQPPTAATARKMRRWAKALATYLSLAKPRLRLLPRSTLMFLPAQTDAWTVEHLGAAAYLAEQKHSLEDYWQNSQACRQARPRKKYFPFVPFTKPTTGEQHT